MEVVATQPGFYQRLRRKGERFQIPDELFSKTWMEKVEVGGDREAAESPKSGDKNGSKGKAGGKNGSKGKAGGSAAAGSAEPAGGAG